MCLMIFPAHKEKATILSLYVSVCTLTSAYSSTEGKITEKILCSSIFPTNNKGRLEDGVLCSPFEAEMTINVLLLSYLS